MFNLFNKNNDEKVIEYLKEGAFLVDVRTPEEFAGGTAEGAINIPLQVLYDHFDQFEGKERTVVFCRSGNRSGQAKQILIEEGYTNIENGGGVEHVIELQAKMAADESE